MFRWKRRITIESEFINVSTEESRTEALSAKRAAEQRVRQSRARTVFVVRLATELKDQGELNHFTELLTLSMRQV